MGKSKTKRFGSIKPNPIGLVNGKIINEQEAQINDDQAANIPAALTNIIEKLQAPTSEERACGCQLMAGIVSQPKAIGYLLRENVVKMTAPLFLDKCLDVRKSALGALRNMSVYGQADVSEVMIDHDVLTPLTALLQTYNNGWLPEKEASKYDTNVDVLIESLELLSNLCESNNSAVKRFNKENLLTTILPLLNVEVYGYQLCNAAARCLLVVSENNSEATTVCQKLDVVSSFLKIIESDPHGIDAVLLRTLVTGILLNLPEVDLSLHYKGIIKAILQVLDMDSFSVIDAALQSSQLDSGENTLENELTWPEVDKLLTAQGVSLELLANMCCSDEEWEDVENSELSSDDQTMDMEEDSAESASEALCLPSEIASAFLEENILSKILLKVSPLTEDQTSKLQESHCGKNTLKKLRDLQTRCLLCISNIVGAVDESLLSQSTPLSTIWTGLYQLLQISSATEDEDLRWALTSALRAVIQRMTDLQQTESVSSIQASDIDFLVGVAKATNNRETQINVIKILSTIGCMSSVTLSSLLQKIGAILLEVACHNEDVIVVSESLDSLFDVFKEDDTDGVAKEISLVDQLVALQASFKLRIKEKRKELGENFSVVMMAKSNLAGFIKYKLSKR
ncbi:HEAT repeat-containing protein 3-like [Biomphalaria glabrata]|uniref:HEAT repeat-containing protein 3-like n=2 Tax=Biomphalaria glabrata TaxID=6526 RepID=A0A9U8EEU5_BIOGL|nr:HEAT repeat-containing protein 3-like [Biomphalaria glabrata]